MKKFYSFLLLNLIVISSVFSQTHVNYDRDSRWFIGINGGSTFHTQTETPILYRGGYGFTFGKSIGMDPRKFFAWDIRARFLHAFFAGQGTSPYNLDSTSVLGLNGTTIGYNGLLQGYQDSIGYFVPNFRTTAARFSLELVLNTNRLRERTGWNLSVFGGIGVTGYHVKTDLTDGFGNIYDYDAAGSYSKGNLLSFQDNDFETDLVGTDDDFEWNVMPSFGVGISYQLSPAVAFGIEHKMTWTRTDWFDGMPNSYSGAPSGLNDIYHYTSLGFKFHLFGSGHADVDTDINNFDTNNNNTDQNQVVQQPPAKKPVIEIYDPSTNPYTTGFNQFTIQANIYHIDGKSNVTFKQNGVVNNNFTYNAYSDQFMSSVVLKPGQNIFEISAYNDAGSDYESTVIIYEVPMPVQNPPIVTITNPPYSPYNTLDEVFNMTSTVLNVDSKSQIQVYFNGQYISNFNYNASTNQVSASLTLHEGTNTVMVTATNNAGSDSKTATIIYTKPITIQPPVVTYVNPAINPYTHGTNNINVIATVLNVNSQADITVKVNGVATTNFSYNITTKELLLNTNLIEGANIVETKAVNSAGMDIEATTIIYNKPNTKKPPVITYLDPASQPTVVFVPTYNVVAKVDHVSSSSQITLKINGVVSNAFTFSASSHIMTFTTGLVSGSNVIEITAVNQDGQDIESTTITYKKTIAQAPPVVTITYPAVDNVEFTTPSVTLTATVLNVATASDIQVIVNGNSTSAFSFNTATKILNLPLVLNPGSNTIQITGTNSAGTDTKSRIIIYKEPVVPTPPTVAFTSPASSPYANSTANYTIVANTTNITSKSQIELKMNGVIIPDANYTLSASYQIIYNANLNNGNNIFEVTVANTFGADQDLALVTYEPPVVPCIIPTVGYISPVPYSTVTTANVNVDAQINNYSAGTTIELKVNGVSQGYMNFNTGTSIASAPAILSPGSNAITVIVTNNCGTNLATFTLNYQEPNPPCNDPTVSAIGATVITTQATTINLQATATNVPASSNIAVTMNGTSIPFTYDLGSGLININNAALAVGNNSIVVAVNNSCGNAVLVYNILREVCNAPVISNMNPANASTTSNATINFTANIANASAADITVLVNGISQAINYDASTNLLTLPVNLNIGANTINISVTTNCGAANQNISITREIPCEPIAYSLVNPASSDVTVTNANYSILVHTTGSLTASQITATQNGNPVNFTYDPITGNVSIPSITLVDGSNNIVIALNNACSSSTINYNITYNGCQPPVITITGIGNGATVNSNSLPFVASITNSNGAANINLTLNGSSVGFDFNETSGLLTANLLLNEGANAIVLNVNGCQVANQSININYVIPCQDVAVTLMQPSALSQTVTISDYSISLSALNIDNSSQINVTQNGNQIPFNFNSGTGIISINGIVLTDGVNNISVTTTNPCSSVTTNYQITYNGCQPPVVTITSTQTAVSSPNYSLNATVTNITNQSDITVLVNSAPVAFTFNSTTGQVNADLVLIEGASTIEVLANGCQNASQVLMVTYTIPCIPITYSLGTPATNTASVADANYSIDLFAQNVSSANITVTLNGNMVPFTFVDNIISINNLTLIDGANTVVVTLNNNCSNETITYIINHNSCNTPVITIGSNSNAVSTATYAFTAQVTNVDNASQITLTLNGNTVPFNFTAGVVSANITLNEGSNAIALNVTACENASANLNVVYTIPCNPITYTLVSPEQLATTIQSASTTITLNVTNVTSSSDIAVVMNGSNVPFNYSGGVVTISIANLIDGTNNLAVTLTNNCSTETINYVINSNQCQPPTINLTSVNTTVTDPLFNFAAQVYNITNSNQLVLTVNGTSVNVNYDAGTHVASAQFSLQPGANAIVLTANGCEVATGNYSITYNVPCNPPVITISSANTVTNAVYNLAAIVTNIDNPASISVTLNGQPVSASYNASSNQLSASLNLTSGSNTIVVNAVGCEIASQNFNVTYNVPCNAPVVTVTSPTTATDEVYNLVSTVSNIDNPSAISVTLNGQAVSASYNTGTDQLTANLTLVDGNNTIVITANGCEVGTATLVVNFTEPSCTRINPGNSTWEFCLITPNGTYTRDNLANDINFTYSGPATSLYCKPIAGGGDAIVNGAPYAINTGQYYLFTGNLNVVVANDNPSAMGHWEVCIEADNVPIFGNGANKPASPCEAPPCNAPVVTITSSNASTQAAYNLAATITNIDSPSSISVTLNGQSVAASYNTSSDALTANLTLVEGNNTIVINANGCSTESQTFVVSYTAPAGNDDIDFTIGDNGTVTVNENSCATITCLGESVVYSNSQEAYVKIQFSMNGGSSWYGFAGDQNVAGGESTSVNCPSGSNVVIKAICTNANNNWSNTLLSNSNSQWVYVLQNGDMIPNYNPADGQLPLDAFLAGYITSSGIVTIGPNDVIYLFELRHVGSVGIDYQDVVMLVSFNDNPNCPAPVNPKSAGGVGSGEVYKAPVITPMNPVNNAIEVSTAQYAFKAKVSNINEAQDIQVSLNGAPAQGFNYNFTTQELTGNLSLNSGANVVTITAVNGNKSANSSFSITYKPKDVVDPSGGKEVLTPVITTVSPLRTTETVTTSTYMFKVKVTNVASKNDIKLNVNGVAFTGFTYSTSMSEVTAVITLKQGANTVIVNAVNGDKSASLSYTITYTPPTNQQGKDTNGGGTNTGSGTNTGTEQKGGGSSTNTNSGGTNTNSGGTEQKGGGTSTNTNSGGTNTGSGGTTQKGGGTTTNTNSGGTSTNTNSGGTQKGGGTTTTTNTGTTNTNSGGTEQKGGGTTTTTTTGGGTQKGGGTTTTTTTGGGTQKGGGTTTTSTTTGKGG